MEADLSIFIHVARRYVLINTIFVFKKHKFFHIRVAIPVLWPSLLPFVTTCRFPTCIDIRQDQREYLSDSVAVVDHVHGLNRY
jgi:hypothetical protein